ncbi:hypothetical protein C1Y40_02342 [Mycobacterium talmoniae]|uniref:Uncharacterized protein n=1 Tax=Mycobacterium talmoniae TaxID=1858794 RepID=A0A2S8BLC1_9MYCO|nr:hypothetical protein C1Y40_02342 [Mycobacterium talmoniae]
MLATRPRRHPDDAFPVGDQRAEPVAAAAVEVGDRGRGRHRQVPFLAAGGAEIQAGRHVDHQPGFQLPVGDLLPHVRVGGAGGDRPVHPAHVVAGLVEPRLAGLGARPRNQAQVVAVQHPVELASDGQFQGAQRRRQLRVVDIATQHRRRMRGPRLGPGARIAHRALAAAVGATGGAELGCCGTAFTCGRATVCSTRLMTISGVISSASAS